MHAHIHARVKVISRNQVHTATGWRAPGLKSDKITRAIYIYIFCASILVIVTVSVYFCLCVR